MQLTKVCEHPEAYIEKACCPGGTRDCACYGRDVVICPSPDCTGIIDSEVDELFNRLGEQ